MGSAKDNSPTNIAPGLKISDCKEEVNKEAIMISDFHNFGFGGSQAAFGKEIMNTTPSILSINLESVDSKSMINILNRDGVRHQEPWVDSNFSRENQFLKIHSSI